MRVEGIKRSAQTFEVLPKRWIVQRTFGWLNRYRQLSKDYEMYTVYADSRAAMIYEAWIRLIRQRQAA